MIKVLVVDDHELLREGIRKLLDEMEDIQVVGEADSGERAMEMTRENIVPDVILMDVKMPGIGGMEATRRILQSNEKIKVIALTACSDEPYPSRLLQAGAQGYITKGCGVAEMVQAIRKVYSGEPYLSPEVAQQLALKHLSDDSDSPFDKLSDREVQVMLMITSGQKVQDISDKLYLSPKTVNSYRYRLFDKLGVTNDVELTHLAIRHGMLSQELFAADDVAEDETS